MSVEGLQTILRKEPVVGTQAVDTLCQNPQMVEDAYLHHVRSFIPLGRVAQGNEDAMTVTAFERRLIDLVKRAQAPTGYVTADYGYGKTSTCIYLWDRCRHANLIAVPPFQVVHLSDLIRAAHAWARYEIERRTPALAARADEIYQRYISRSVEDLAKGDATRLQIYRDLQARGQMILELPASRYVQFFEEMSALACESGFDGLVLLPDELQQYIDPEIRKSTGDPLAPLFDLVQSLVTRKGALKFGLIFSIPRVTLSLLNDRRGDLVQRLKMHGLAFDLLTAYSPGFARELWQHLSDAFDCKAEAPQVIQDVTLEALGQIAARDDLANGPRTVVNVFATMIKRYLGGKAAYTPVDLIDDFLSGAIAFDGAAKLQTKINQALATPLVIGDAARGRAVRLIAAFPTFGCPREVQDAYGLAAACDDLAAAGQGELVLYLGGGIDHEGHPLPMGMTLVGLEPHSGEPNDWLTSTLRQFWRVYYEGDVHTGRRAVAGFVQLLRERVFTQSHFALQEIREGRLTQSNGLMLEGSFPATARTYPKREVHVRVLLEDEIVRDKPEGDLTIEFRLLAHLDQVEQQRWLLSGSVTLDKPRTSVFALNLSHRTAETIYSGLQALQPIISPHKLTPQFMLALYGYLEEQRSSGAIPQSEDPLVKNTFQVSLLDRCMAELFNMELGAAQGKAGVALVEEVFRSQCQALFPNYTTFMTTPQWSAGLRDYKRALKDLSSVVERRGDQPVETTRDNLARLLGRTTAALDTFFSSYPALLKLQQPGFAGKAQNFRGVVVFSLHPLERSFLTLLRGSRETVTLTMGRTTHTVHRIGKDVLYEHGYKEGYRDEEIGAALDLLVARELVVLQDQSRAVLESPRGAMEREDVREVLDEAQALLTPLLTQFATDSLLRQQQEQFTALRGILNSPEKIAEDRLIQLANNVAARKRQIDTFITDKWSELRSRLAQITSPGALAPSRLQALNAPLPRDFFGVQLEGIRAVVLREGQRYGQALQELEAHRRRLGDDPLSAAPEPAKLVQLAGGVENLRRGTAELAEQRQRLDVRLSGFEWAGAALETAIRLAQSLTQAGEAGAPFAAELETMMRGVNGELSSRKAEALESASDWAAQLRQFARDVDEALVGEECRFNQTQERYRRSLIEIGVAEAALPAPTPFNRQNPQGSLTKLHNDLRTTLEDKTDALPPRLSSFQAMLHQQEARCAEYAAGQTDVIRKRIAEIGGQLTAALQESQELRAQAGDPEVLTDFPPEGAGRFQDFLNRFRALIANSGAIRAAINQVTAAIDHIPGANDEPRPSLTPEQQQILATIQQTGSRDRAVDISVLTRSGTSVPGVMKTLGELYLAGKILIQVTVPHTPGSGDAGAGR